MRVSVEHAATAAWVYLDDTDAQQGPFPEPLMRAWFLAGYFDEDTMVRCTSSHHGMFLPLSVLFPVVQQAFDGGMAWMQEYDSAHRYQDMLNTALSLGCDPLASLQHMHLMRENGLPPDVSLLLDLMGVSELPELTAASPAPRSGGEQLEGGAGPAPGSSASASAPATPVPPPPALGDIRL
jgi:hypothetical protein